MDLHGKRAQWLEPFVVDMQPMQLVSSPKCMATHVLRAYPCFSAASSTRQWLALYLVPETVKLRGDSSELLGVQKKWQHKPHWIVEQNQSAAEECEKCA